MRLRFVFSFLLLICPFISFSSNILIKPTNEGPEIAIIFLEGALIPCDRYVSLAYKIQEKMPNHKVWISIPDVFLELPFEITANSAIQGGLKDLINSGFSSGSKVYIAGHSMGGTAAADWGLSHVDQISGIIQLGSFLDRKYRNTTLKTPILMVGGELDGLSRITRFAEEYYNRILNRDINQAIKETPIVVLEGVNHMQFSSGEPSSFVKLRDLKAENTEEVSHEMISTVIANFLSGNLDALKSQVLKTGDLLAPLISAFELEGSIHFNRPSQSDCTQGYCSKGSDWVIKAQEILAGKELYDQTSKNLIVSNDYVILSSLPPLGKLFHPKIYENGNKINITTYSQCSWDFFDKYVDGGFNPVSAKEIGSKMLTRQCSFVFGLGHSKNDTPFSIDDGFDWCAEINKNAYEYGLNHSAAKSASRFSQHGQAYVFGSDEKKTSGFGWVYTELQYQENDKGEMVVSAPVMVSDIDAPPVPIFAPDGGNCYHYCKLLSPARAMEWIYVDGLRKNYGI